MSVCLTLLQQWPKPQQTDLLDNDSPAAMSDKDKWDVIAVFILL